MKGENKETTTSIHVNMSHLKESVKFYHSLQDWVNETLANSLPNDSSNFYNLILKLKYVINT